MYAFNVTNSDNWLAGRERLRVDEVGPFVYRWSSFIMKIITILTMTDMMMSMTMIMIMMKMIRMTMMMITMTIILTISTRLTEFVYDLYLGKPGGERMLKSTQTVR